MEKQPISREVINLSAERMNRESRESIGRIAVRRTREFDEEIYTTLEDDLQEMPDRYLLRLHDSVCNEGPEYSYVLNRVKKELARRALEY
jgi:hypothetical protein